MMFLFCVERLLGGFQWELIQLAIFTTQTENILVRTSPSTDPELFDP